MKTATGNYLNLYSETGHHDVSDLFDCSADIYILFYESCDIDLAEADERARKALKAWNENDISGPLVVGFEKYTRKLEQYLKDKFLDEAVFVKVRLL